MNNIDWNKFATAICDFTGSDASEITKDTDLYEDLCMDSLGMFSLGMHITETFNVEVPLSSVATISKIGEMYTLLNEKGTPKKD